MRIQPLKILTILPLLVVGLTACDTLYPPTPKPDNTIHMVQTPTGLVAEPPTCASWATANINPYDEQPLPQFGCANARNLAMMVERPGDLVKGRDFGNANPTTTVGAQLRYTHNQTRGLLDLSTAADMSPAATTSSTASSGLNGDTPSGGSASSSSTSSSPSAGGAAASP